MKQLKVKLSSVYHSFFPEFKSWQVPDEEIATCHDCTMCRKPESAFVNTKCCTYFPMLPNYLVGGILLDDSPELAEGKKRIREKIKNRRGVTPYGIIPDLGYDNLLESLRRIDENQWTRQQADSVLCPYYMNGNCTIWNYRENCCSTHFCISVGGDLGKKFWNTFNDYLKFTENHLSKYALNTLGFNTSKINVNRLSSKDYAIEDDAGNIIDSQYAALWDNWHNQEEELYIKAFKIVRDLTQNDFAQIGGLDQEIYYQKLEKSFLEYTNPAIPQYLILNPKALVKQENSQVITYESTSGSIKAEGIVNVFIKLFDGINSTDEICKQVASLCPAFREDYLIKFYHLKILIPKP